MSGYMDFSDALRAAKQGSRVSHLGLVGEWISTTCTESKEVPADGFWSVHNRKHAEDNGGSAIVLPALTLKTKEGHIMMGWLPNAIDLFTTKWYIVE